MTLVFPNLVGATRSWSVDWAWGLPLIVLTVVIHVLGLSVINQKTIRISSCIPDRRHPTIAFALIMGAVTLATTTLHGLEATVWAAVYWFLGALPDNRSAMLYSLNAMTSYGHTDISLEPHWYLMGAMEALDGWLLFGLTTAFLFGTMEKIKKLSSKSP